MEIAAEQRCCEGENGRFARNDGACKERRHLPPPMTTGSLTPFALATVGSVLVAECAGRRPWADRSEDR